MYLVKELDAYAAKNPKFRAGKSKREFLALKDEIGKAMVAGYSAREIWEFLNEKGLISVKYETFSDYIRRHGLRRLHVPLESGPQTKSDGPAAVEVSENEKQEKRQDEENGSSSPKGFKHDPVPQKERLI